MSSDSSSSESIQVSQPEVCSSKEKKDTEEEKEEEVWPEWALPFKEECEKNRPVAKTTRETQYTPTRRDTTHACSLVCKRPCPHWIPLEVLTTLTNVRHLYTRQELPMKRSYSTMRFQTPK